MTRRPPSSCQKTCASAILWPVRQCHAVGCGWAWGLVRGSGQRYARDAAHARGKATSAPARYRLTEQKKWKTTHTCSGGTHTESPMAPKARLRGPTGADRLLCDLRGPTRVTLHTKFGNPTPTKVRGVEPPSTGVWRCGSAAEAAPSECCDPQGSWVVAGEGS